MINKWELDTTELIKQSAACARERLQEIALKEGDNLQKQFVILSSEIDRLRENENYFENDIDQLINKLQQLHHEIEHFPVELSIEEISHELIVVKPLTQSVCHTAAPCYFVDLLLTSQKPKVSIHLLPKAFGPMYPASDQLIAFSYKHQLHTLNIAKKSWKSLHGIKKATEVHWFSSFKQFLVLSCSGYDDKPNKLYLFNPYSDSAEEIWAKSADWTYGSPRNFKTLTCFKQHILIVADDRIEKWSPAYSDWYTNEEASARWSPPISCYPDGEIICIRMNDLYYAVLIETYDHQSRSLVFSFQLRSHGMSTLRCIEIDYDKSLDKLRLISLPNASGWLFLVRGENKNCCYVLDNDGKRYDQNTVLLSKVIDIGVQNNLIFLRKKVANSTNDVLEIYDWQK
ncbi:unnamed protein product [Adineta steineri]|uniref:Uncharacterized protein n=1 Tax=Adineta steineri TaxID=433720 RepID=A0A814JBD9_9BILA|nr:unnamed protein product [Adineta steineri]